MRGRASVGILIHAPHRFKIAFALAASKGHVFLAKRAAIHKLERTQEFASLAKLPDFAGLTTTVEATCLAHALSWTPNSALKNCALSGDVSAKEMALLLWWAKYHLLCQVLQHAIAMTIRYFKACLLYPQSVYGIRAAAQK